jgi:Na+/phosphate symporter
MVIYLPPLVFVGGLLIFFSIANPKWNKVGETMMWCGLLVTCWEFASKAFRLP